MWRKAGDRFGVGKKARPMGARLHCAESKAYLPLAQLYPLLAAAAGLGSSWWWWCSEVRSRLEFFVQMELATAFSRQKKRATQTVSPTLAHVSVP
jgi:hypothetical protein